jgi:hypothetical protein
MPVNGSAHYALATALNPSGQKEEAQKEFGIHRSLTRIDTIYRLSPFL